MKTPYLYISYVTCLLFGCRKIIILALLQTILGHLSSDHTAYGGSGEEAHGHFILTCSDGGYLQVGELVSYRIPQKYWWSRPIQVVFSSGQGNSQGTGHNLGNSAFEGEDGYFICGSLNENSAIIKLNKSDGSIVFEKTHDNGGSDAFEHISVTQEGIIVVGYIQAEDNLNTFFTEGQGYLTILDLDGNKTKMESILKTICLMPIGLKI